MYKKHILVCERGWQGIRELSLDLARRDITSTVLIEGLIDKETREMITSYNGINNLFIPEKIFAPLLYMYILVNLLLFRGKLSIALSKEKTYHRLLRFRKLFPCLELTEVYDHQ